MMLPDAPSARDSGQKAAGLLAAHLREDDEAFNRASDLFGSPGELVHGLLMVASSMASLVGSASGRTPEEVAQLVSLEYARPTTRA